MNDRPTAPPRLRAATPPETPEAARFTARVPQDLLRRLNRMLDEHQGVKGSGRKIVIELHLNDETGEVNPRGTCVHPPREWITP